MVSAIETISGSTVFIIRNTIMIPATSIPFLLLSKILNSWLIFCGKLVFCNAAVMVIITAIRMTEELEKPARDPREEMPKPILRTDVLDIKWITVPLAYFAILGTDNGVNFTDGLDGLASSVTAVVAVFFTIASLALGGGIEPVTAAVAGALLGFLLFNVHPAQVFMGDTGSLALGGFVAGSAYMLRMPWIILVVGLIYLIEVLSVIIQVTYFKKTGGKRFFKMAPIHHHFELCGWSETRIVAVFSTVTMLLCIAGLLLIR